MRKELDRPEEVAKEKEEVVPEREKIHLEQPLAKTGTDRVELYTESYATEYLKGNKKGIEPYIKAALEAQKVGLGLNAGHDLSLDNLKFFKEQIPNLLEVSIGHALISEALYLGLQNVVSMYLYRLK